MGNVAGHKKTGGRTKGTPNKKTEALLDICAKKKVSPFEALIDLAQTTDDEGIKLGALKELCSYLYPKRKAVEMSGPDGDAIDVNNAETRELVQEFTKIVTGYKSERDKK